MVTTRELVIDKPGTYLGVRKGLFVVRGADGSRAEFSPAELSHESISVRFVLVQQDMLFVIFLSSDRSSRPLNRKGHARFPDSSSWVAYSPASMASETGPTVKRLKESEGLIWQRQSGSANPREGVESFHSITR